MERRRLDILDDVIERLDDMVGDAKMTEADTVPRAKVERLLKEVDDRLHDHNPESEELRLRGYEA